MIFRYARHTDNIDRLVRFYVDVIGLKKLGEFKNHSNYNGVFLGFPESDWHIEFTESVDDASHIPDNDDLLVFYTRNDKEFNELMFRIKEMQIPTRKSKNPYWVKNGIEIIDPDGFGIIITGKK